MDTIIFEFVGGPNNGKFLCSGSLNLVEAEYARRAFWVFGIPSAFPEKEEAAECGLGGYRLPSANIRERGKREGWSDAQVQATLRYREYAVIQLRRDQQQVYITARYRDE